eukprot:1195380-Prorocentrum_minimum.AAC.11
MLARWPAGGEVAGPEEVFSKILSHVWQAWDALDNEEKAALRGLALVPALNSTCLVSVYATRLVFAKRPIGNGPIERANANKRHTPRNLLGVLGRSRDLQLVQPRERS